MAEEHDVPGEWLTLAEAAEKLGVSIDTVRRRLHRGELVGKQELTRFGKAWQVRVEPVPSATHSPGQDLPTPETELPSAEQSPRQDLPSPAQVVESQGLLEMVQLIKELQLKAETAAMWQARATMLEEQLGHTQLQLTQAYETLKAIEAPKLEAGEQISELVDQGPHRPWWRFW